MIKLLTKWILLGLVVYGLPFIIPDITVDSFTTALIASAVFAFINLLIKPVVTLITLPVNIITLGLFSLVINAALFWLGSMFVPGFHVTALAGVIFGSLIMSIMRWLIDELF
jgi:putative membrane protein